MASEFIAKTTIFNLSRTLHRSPCRISQVSFSSAASKTHQDQHARNHAEHEPDAGPEAERRAEAGTQRAANVPEKKAREMEERYGELKDTAEEKAPGSLSGEEAREGVQLMHKAREETKRAREAVGDLKDRAKNMAGSAAETAKEGAKGTGEKVTETVKGAWNAAKGAGERIRENLVGNFGDHDETPASSALNVDPNERPIDDPLKGTHRPSPGGDDSPRK